MKSATKSELLSQNSELRAERDAMAFYLNQAFRGQVTHIRKGNVKLSICGECAANGGVVCESWTVKDSPSGHTTSVTGVYYWESYYRQVMAYPVRHDDKDAGDLRDCANAVASHVREKQDAFYAPRVLAAVTNS